MNIITVNSIDLPPKPSPHSIQAVLTAVFTVLCVCHATHLLSPTHHMAAAEQAELFTHWNFRQAFNSDVNCDNLSDSFVYICAVSIRDVSDTLCCK